MSEIIDFAAVTACGECCTGCARKAAGSCNWLVNKVTWNPNLVAHLTALADLYRKRSEHHAADTVV